MITLYQIPVNIMVAPTGSKGNRTMSTPNIVIQRGSISSIEFSVRGMDRKAIDITNSVLTFIMYNRTSGEIVFKRDLVVFDALRGSAKLHISPTDMLTLTPTTYRYAVISDTDGSPQVLHMNENNLAMGSVELRGDVVPVIRPTTTYMMDRFTPVNSGAGSTIEGATVKISPQISGNELITVAVYMTKFYGTIKAQGCLLDSPETTTDWFDISIGDNLSMRFANFTGIETFNIRSKSRWLRFVVEEDPIMNGTKVHSIGDAIPPASGRIDKFLVR